jgi:hypothetical protein
MDECKSVPAPQLQPPADTRHEDISEVLYTEQQIRDKQQELARYGALGSLL